MAVRDDFTAGEVLAAADLNDTFASKPPFAYGTATPSTTVEGFIWYDENDTPPTAKFWDGSAFEPFSSGAGNADFSDAATGTYTDGGIDYKYITYTGSGTITITKSGLFDALLVGGGAGGGAATGGGGGAGGHLDGTGLYLPTGTFTVTVGAGGAGATRPNNQSAIGNNGIASSLAGEYYSPGGGGGTGAGFVFNSTSFYSMPGLNGSSGGGSGGKNAGTAGAGGAGISGLGNDGAASPTNTTAGGGGGAGAAGSGSNGGNGTANSITGTSVTRAGGGGGGTAGTGGSGGGGAGSATTGSNGTANTGGGGGGGENAGGTGGSGVVIIRVRTN
jgi:hypothetical protein